MSQTFMNGNIVQLMAKADLDLAEQVHEKPCPYCGGRLNWANYARHPRGLNLEGIRYSLCCGQEGCRRRQTPQSLRFLGRKVYAGAIVVLVSAMQSGLSGPRVGELRKRLGIGRATLNRWPTWWLREFVQTRFWKEARARFMPPVCEATLPTALWERFGVDPEPGLVNLLKFISPITTVSLGNRVGDLRGA